MITTTDEQIDVYITWVLEECTEQTAELLWLVDMLLRGEDLSYDMALAINDINDEIKERTNG